MKNPESLQASNCPICSETLTSSAIGPDYVYCKACDFYLQSPFKTQPVYDASYYSRGKGFLNALGELKSRVDYLSIFSEFKKKDRVLDVGCGAGNLLEAMHHHGYEAWGMDSSPSALALAIQKTAPGQVRLGSFDKANFLPEFFDGIVSTHVLEHVEDPIAFLTEIKRLLKKRGVVVLRLPNFASLEARLAKRDWLHFDDPFHVAHYSPRAIRKLLLKVGFTDIRVRPTLYEYKQVLLYSLISFVTRTPSNPARRIYWLPLQILGMPVSFLLALVFRNAGTMEVSARK